MNIKRLVAGVAITAAACGPATNSFGLSIIGVDSAVANAAPGGQDQGLDPGQGLGRTPVEPGRHPRRTAAVDPGRHHMAAHPDLLDHRAVVPDLHLRRTVVVPDLHPDNRAVVPDLHPDSTAADLGLHRANTVVLAGSRPDRTLPHRRPPNCAATSTGRVDPVRRRVQPTVASMGTSGVREPPRPTSVETSADRVALMPASTAAFTGQVRSLETSGPTSAVQVRRPLGLGLVPAETSACT